MEETRGKYSVGPVRSAVGVQRTDTSMQRLMVYADNSGDGLPEA